MRLLKIICIFSLILTIFAQYQVGLIWGRTEYRQGNWASPFVLVAEDEVIVWNHGKVAYHDEWTVYEDTNRDSVAQAKIAVSKIVVAYMRYHSK